MPAATLDPTQATATRQPTLWGDPDDADCDLDTSPGLPRPDTFPVVEWDALCDRLERLESHYPGRTIEAEAVPGAFEVQARWATLRHLKEAEARLARDARHQARRDAAAAFGDLAAASRLPRKGRAWDVAGTGIPDVRRLPPAAATRAMRREMRALRKAERDERLRRKVAGWLLAAGFEVPEPAKA